MSDPSLDFLEGGGAMAALIRSMDWSRTALGPIGRWPHSLRTAVSICLTSRFPMLIWWGPRLTMIYNDAYRPMLGALKHPSAMGCDGQACWPEIWHIIGPMLHGVLEGQGATWSADQLLPLERSGFVEECFFTFSYSPIRDESGGIAGVFTAVTETTERVVGERRLRTLNALAGRLAAASDADAVWRVAAQVLADDPADLPAAFLCSVSHGSATPTAWVVGGRAFDGPAPELQGCAGDALLETLRAAAAAGDAIPAQQLFAAKVLDAAPARPAVARASELRVLGGVGITGYLVVALNPRRSDDAGYRGFVSLVAGHIETALANVRAMQAERERVAALAELDRAKTVFFSNISHEFRTPLSLILAPLDAALSDGALADRALSNDDLAMVHRNALRLQKLVNALLEFSRIEAGRVSAVPQRTDLAGFTIELASMFRSAIERAGVRYLVDCRPVGDVDVDRDMWERIVLNLLSNAFKFTLQGEITVRLTRDGDAVRLQVLDTGCGIPPESLPHVFERFHRAEGASARSQEGSGIGLALVHELVRLQQGRVDVDSVLGRGSCFVVELPLPARAADERPPPPQAASLPAREAPSSGARAYLAEALQWQAGGTDAPVSGDARACVLVADDNADMRAYLERLLTARYRVQAVADGALAWQAIVERAPDVVVADVMMPGLDGFALAAAVRADPRTCDTPIVLLSARAGEEDAVRGLQSGADDYLVKPFRAAELMSRVGAQVERRARTRELQGLLEQAPGFMAVLHGPEHRYAAANAAYRRLCGDRPLLGRTVREALPEMAGQGYFELLDRAYRSGEPVTGRGARVVVARAPGQPPEPIYLDFVYQPIRGAGDRVDGIFVQGHDVTEQHRAMQALRDSEERFRLVLASPSLGTFEIDFPSETATLSQAALDAFDLDRNPIPLADMQARVEPDDWPAVERALLAARDPMGSGEFRVRHRTRHRNGAVRWLDVLGRVRFAEDARGMRRAMRLAGVSWDVTEREQLAQRLADADRRKDDFLAMLAHELRNPLAPIRNAARLIERSTDRRDPDARLATASAIILRQVGHMSELLDDLLDVARVTRGHIALAREPVDLADIVADAIEQVRPLVDARRQSLETELPRERIVVDGDRVRLVQVLSNLLNNAAKYTADGGHVSIAVEASAHWVTIRVRDDGAGIAPAFLPQVFELFTQAERSTDRSQGGLGLGLSLVKSLVELHGGRVAARSDGLGRGSEFVVQLPRAAQVPASAGSTQAGDAGDRRHAPAGPVRAARVLVVDDHEDAAQSLAMCLAHQGHDVSVATASDTALRLAQARAIDVALLDIGLPGLDGYALARALRAMPGTRDTLIVAITGYGQPADRERARRAGFDHHLVKPVDPQTLEQVIRRRWSPPA